MANFFREVGKSSTDILARLQDALIGDGPSGQNGGGSQSPVSGGVKPGKVKVSENDSTVKYLLEKLLAGSGITLSEQNDGADEKVEIASSGAGGGLDFLQSDPASPSEGDSWILQNPGQLPTTFEADIFDDYFMGEDNIIDLQMGSPSLNKIETLFNNGPFDNYYFVFTPRMSLMVNAQVGIIATDNQDDTLNFEFLNGTATIQDMVDAINTYSQNKIGEDIASVGSDVQGTDDLASALPANSTSGPFLINYDGSEETMTLKVQGASGIFTRSLTK